VSVAFERMHSRFSFRITYVFLCEYNNNCFKLFSFFKLFDASVVSPTGGRLVEEKYRSGKVCRIFDDQAKGVLDSLNTRIERITGWSTRTAEAYQIVNYGLGGHYVHHYDSLNRQRVRIIQNTVFRL